MKEFEVNIRETSEKIVTVEAVNKEMAEKLVALKYVQEEIVFSAEDNKKIDIDVIMPEFIAVFVEPMKKPTVISVDTSVEGLESIIGGYPEISKPFDDPVVLVTDESGKLKGLTKNRCIFDDGGQLKDIVAGSFLILGDSSQGMDNLSEELIEKYKNKFIHGETIKDVGNQVVRSVINLDNTRKKLDINKNNQER